MCKDKNFINCRFICKHKGMTADCPKFRAKASCSGCGGTHYKDEMTYIDDKTYLCELCTAEQLVTKAQDRGQAHEVRC